MLKRLVTGFKNSIELKKRIKHRHETFWKDEIGEKVRNVSMSARQSWMEWKDVDYWQRKLSNKFNAREFAKKNGCLVPDLYWKGRDTNEIDFSKLPPYYIIRPTVGHSSKLVFVMADGKNLFDNETYTPCQIKSLLAKELSENDKVEFLIEEFLKNEDGHHSILTDYKFFCFNGQIATVMVINRLSPSSGFASFYDENWNEMEMVQMNYPRAETQKRPACLDNLVNCAKRLSKAYGIFVRIDFYATYKGCVFGEFTPTPSMGTKFTRYGKQHLLKHWDTYCTGLI